MDGCRWVDGRIFIDHRDKAHLVIVVVVVAIESVAAGDGSCGGVCWHCAALHVSAMVGLWRGSSAVEVG
jgi:hypothetical protein